VKKLGILSLIAALFLVSPKPARAVTIGDAALTVSIGTAAGAILGASTLPFYSDSGKHTKNIFYGAAIGAVAGVLVAAYAGVSEGAGEEDAKLRRQERDTLFAASRRLSPERSTALSAREASGQGKVLAWSPVARFSF